MPNWGAVLAEIQATAAGRGRQGPDFDAVRLKYISQVRGLSGSAVILYGSGWLRSGGRDNLDYAVEGGDVHALMEVCHEVAEERLDLVIHSPGGSPAAAEQMVNYLRTQFDYIRAIIPLQAKSAATMIALGCDEIVMGEHSELGPIDPQITMSLPGGSRFAPAHAILRDFERAKDEIARDVNVLPAWTPILHAYAGGLLEFCTQQIRLSQEIVAGWLHRYMLAHADAVIPEADRERVAAEIAEYFGSDKSYDRFRTHSRPIRIEELRKLQGLRIRSLEDDTALQDAVLSLYHALDITFGGSAVKVVENHRGARYVRVQQQIMLGPFMPVPQPDAGRPQPQSPQPPPPAA